MNRIKRIKYLIALGQAAATTVTTPTPVRPLDSSSVLFTNLAVTWGANISDQIKILANILNKAILNTSEGRISLERIKQGTTAQELKEGSPKITLELAESFVNNIINMPIQATKEQKIQKANEFKSDFTNKKSQIKSMDVSELNQVINILTSIIPKI